METDGRHISSDYSATLSAALRMARFPMIIGIIVIHSFLPLEVGRDAMPAAAYGAMYVGSEIISRICVPLFFAISGFLFFYRKERIDAEFFRTQWKKRVRTLLVPYILWNILAFLFLLFKTWPPVARFFPGMEGVDLSFGKFLLSFWDFSYTDAPRELDFFDPVHGPVDFPLWFICDLIILCLVSPLTYGLVRTMRWFFPVLLAVCFVGGWWPAYCPGFSITGVLFFSVGCYFAIEKKNPLALLWGRYGAAKVTSWLTVVYVLLVAADLLTIDNGNVNLHIHAIGILIGVCWFFSLLGLLSSRGRSVLSFLTASSFFVFAFHGMIASIVCKVAIMMYNPAGTVAWVVAYLSAILLMAGVSVGMFALCRKVLPRVTAILTGGRCY